MRRSAWLFCCLALAACAHGSSTSATLVLKNRYWDHVNVEAVVTKSDKCGDAKDYLIKKKFVLAKGETQSVKAPQAQNICWRHDENPNKPAPGAWSDWSRATMFPGQTIDSDL